MKIKQLEIKGFKSFKNRTVIRFGKGVSGVVGPNGCGKSNVVDAFLWVMGETAPKHLRGSAMEDLIFAGTNKQPPAGIAEVSLIVAPAYRGRNFDAASASDRDCVPVNAPAYRGGDGDATSVSDRDCVPVNAPAEVMITRRLDKDGKSEYLINSRPSRLKDVQEIFMDTGAGIHGFSFIEQGAVENFISSKPEQKRLLIESAAGISKFRSRKREAERKLALTEINLKRLKDILLRQTAQLQKLKKQSAKAELFRNLKKQIREKDILISQWELIHTHREKQMLDKQIQEKIQKNKERKKELSRTQARVRELKQKHEDCKLRVAKMEKTLPAVRENFLSLEKDLAGLRASLQANKQNLGTAGEVSSYKQNRLSVLNQIEEVGAQISKWEKKQTALQEEWEQVEKECENETRRAGALTVRLRTLETDLVNCAHQEALTKAQAEAFIGQIREGDREAGEWELLLKKKTGELKKGESQKKQLLEELEQKKQLSFNIGDSVRELKQSAQSLQKDIQDQESRLKQAQEDASALYAGLKSFKKAGALMSAGDKGLRFVLQSAEDEKAFIETSSSVRVLDPVLEKAISTYMAHRLKSVFCFEKQQALSAVELLNKNQGLCRFVFPLAGSSKDSSAEGEGEGSSKAGSAESEGEGSSKDKSAEGEGEGSSKAGSAENEGEGSSFQLRQEPGFKYFVKDKVEGRAEVTNLLFSRVGVVDSIHTAFRLREKYSGWDFITLTGEALTREGDLVAGRPAEEEINILAYHRAMRDMPIQYEDKKKQAELISVSLQKTKALYQEAMNKLAGLNEREGGVQVSRLTIKKDLEVIERDCGRITAELSEIRKKLMEYRQKRQELQNKKDMLDGGGGEADYSAKRSAIKVELQQARQECTKAEQDRDMLLKQKEQLWRARVDCEKELTGLREKQSFLEQSLKSGEHKEREWLSLSLKKKALIQDYEKQLKEKEQQRRILSRQKESGEREISALVREREQTAEHIEQAQALVVELHQGMGDIDAVINDLKLKIEGLSLKQSSVVERIGEKYQIELSCPISAEEEVASPSPPRGGAGAESRSEAEVAFTGTESRSEEEVASKSLPRGGAGAESRSEAEVAFTGTESRSEEEVASKSLPRGGAGFDKEEEELQLKKLNNRLSAMGEVNLLALRECEDLQKEHDFYKKQYEDLCASKEKLSQVIKRIDGFCSKKFKQVFDEVNSCFSRVWPSLFEGGKAELVLVKDKEGGSADGMDIMVQPPGKKVQNMNLLSGGEKAMTAVAVIFSIFLVNPPPFCILDEVDAPLDDINIVRFNSLLAEMAKVSQVIIITHNKYTMRECGHLYGVTMEEKGISKIVSLNMQSLGSAHSPTFTPTPT